MNAHFLPVDELVNFSFARSLFSNYKTPSPRQNHLWRAFRENCKTKH